MCEFNCTQKLLGKLESMLLYQYETDLYVVFFVKIKNKNKIKLLLIDHIVIIVVMNPMHRNKPNITYLLLSCTYLNSWGPFY